MACLAPDRAGEKPIDSAVDRNGHHDGPRVKPLSIPRHDLDACRGLARSRRRAPAAGSRTRRPRRWRRSGSWPPSLIRGNGPCTPRPALCQSRTAPASAAGARGLPRAVRARRNSRVRRVGGARALGVQAESVDPVGDREGVERGRSRWLRVVGALECHARVADDLIADVVDQRLESLDLHRPRLIVHEQRGYDSASAPSLMPRPYSRELAPDVPADASAPRRRPARPERRRTLAVHDPAAQAIRASSTSTR